MIRRYLRALIGAFRMTLSGKTPPPSPMATLRAWMTQTPLLVDTTLAACTKAGLDESARREKTLIIEGRRVNLNTVLLATKFHALQEYPMLIATPDGRSLTALYGTNVNDCFLLGRFLDVLPVGEAQLTCKNLINHLTSVPKPPES